MRTPVPFLPAILLACALSAAIPAARAAEGLYLTWNDCALAPVAAGDFSSTCTSNAGEQSLFCAFRLPAPVDSVLGVEIVVDVQHADATLPDWWEFDAGGCRAGNLRVGLDFTAQSGCKDFFFGNAAGGLQGYYPTEPRGALSQARIKVAASVLVSLGGYASLDSTSMYYSARLTFTNTNTVSPGTVCQGCLAPACLVFNSILIRRQPGAVGGDVFLSQPGPGNANWATWRGGAGANCSAVPVRRVTWGRVKGLYR